MTENMDFMESRMLHAYLDGELDGAQEEALFRMLSEDPFLRAEMQDQLSIRKAIQHDNQAFMPPVAATAAIFSTLGFSIPTTASAAIGGAGGRLWFASGSAIVAVATSLLLSMLFQGTIETHASPPGSTAHPAIVLQIEDAPALPDSPLTVTDGSGSSSVSEIVAEVAEPSSPLQEAEFAAPVLAEIFCQPVDVRNRSSEPDLRGVRAPFTPYVNLLRIPQDGLILYVRNSTLRSQPFTDVQNASGFALSDMNVGVLAPLSGNHAIGVEFGRETFPQRFSGSLRGASVVYEQSPSVYCATAVYQFTSSEILPRVHPFAQVQMGTAHKIGPLARATMGIAIKPVDRISVLVGAEGSILAYKFQNRWFDTRKYGLTYGLRYEF